MELNDVVYKGLSTPLSSTFIRSINSDDVSLEAVDAMILKAEVAGELDTVEKKLIDDAISVEAELFANLNMELKHELFISYMPWSCMSPLSLDSWDSVIDEGMVRPFTPPRVESDENLPPNTPMKKRTISAGKPATSTPVLSPQASVKRRRISSKPYDYL